MTARLIMATPEEEAAFDGPGCYSGRRDLAQDPLALDARKKCPKRVDHVHLSQKDGTNLVQWFARHADGYHRGFGPVMVIVSAP